MRVILDGTPARARPTTATAAAVHVSWQGSGTARVVAGACLLDRRFQLADASLVVDGVLAKRVTGAISSEHSHRSILIGAF